MKQGDQMTERQLETVKGMKVADFLNDEEIHFFMAIKETAAKYKPIPRVDVDGLNHLLFEIHQQNNENGHRWASRINQDLTAYLELLDLEYLGLPGREV